MNQELFCGLVCVCVCVCVSRRLVERAGSVVCTRFPRNIVTKSRSPGVEQMDRDFLLCVNPLGIHSCVTDCRRSGNDRFQVRQCIQSWIVDWLRLELFWAGLSWVLWPLWLFLMENAGKLTLPEGPDPVHGCSEIEADSNPHQADPRSWEPHPLAVFSLPVGPQVPTRQSQLPRCSKVRMLDQADT